MSLVTPWYIGGGLHEAAAKEVAINWPECWASIQMGSPFGCSLAPIPSSWLEQARKAYSFEAWYPDPADLRALRTASENIKKGIFENETLPVAEDPYQELWQR